MTHAHLAATVLAGVLLTLAWATTILLASLRTEAPANPADYETKT